MGGALRIPVIGMASFDPSRYMKDFETAWNAKDPQLAVQAYADNVEFYDPLTGQAVRGKEKGAENARTWFAAFSEMSFRVRSSVVQGNQVAILYDATGRHTGDFQIAPGESIPATNKTATVPMSEFLTLDANGKITRDVVVMDSGKLLMGLGIIPQPGAAQPAGKRMVTR